MNVTIISGSHRTPSQSMKVARHIQQVLQDSDYCESAEIFSLAGNPLPLWDQRVWEDDPEWNEILKPMRTLFGSSDAFVVVSPEWHGQVPAGLKNLFLLCSKNEVGHKPALIVTVSAGDGGAYPVAELRMSSYKNNRLCYIPEQVIVRHVESVLNDDPEKNNPSFDGYFRERIAWALALLGQYGSALKTVRDSGIALHKKFGNGM
ncbi:NADPH-dependent FMN reductase [Sedimenticola sp.]|uniref:NADPH-dependent FMN reductase n=1 Tax=Sedimenticola sp. TaxID=1940285 RepID=UPI003D0A9E26